MRPALVQADELLSQQRFGEALALFEQVLESHRGHGELHRMRDIAQRGALNGGLSAEEHFQLAAALQRAGLNEQAVREYREVLRLVPEAAEAQNNLGSALRALGHTDAAERAFEAALRLRPGYGRALNNLGGLWIEAGRASDARGILEQAVAADPGNANAWINLGAAERAVGALDAAIRAYRRALELQPDRATGFVSLAAALKDRGDSVGALATCTQALRLDPHDARAWVLQAGLLASAGLESDSAAAVSALDRARPAVPSVALELCLQLVALRRIDAAVAVAARALEAAPEHRELRLESARLLERVGEYDRARRCIEPLLTEQASADVWSTLGFVLLHDSAQRSDPGLRARAIKAFERALALEPDQLAPRVALAAALFDAGRRGAAQEQYTRVLAVDPSNPRAITALCDLRAPNLDWQDFDALTDRLKASVQNGSGFVTPMALALRCDEPAILQQAARQLISGLELEPARWRRVTRRRHPKLRVGYLSPDYRDHPVAFAIAPVLEHHDRGRFEVIGIATEMADQSHVAERIRASCDSFSDATRLDRHHLAQMLRDLQLDILVDLAGLTHPAAAGALAQRPAPLQVSYLGFPGTCGATWLDYLIADAFVIPESTRRYYDEQVVWLPDTFLAGEMPVTVPTELTRAAAGLPDASVVLCNFNQPNRLNPQTFDAFVRILQRAPESVLWLREPTSEGVVRACERAHSAGVAPDRLIFAPDLPTREEYLGRLRLADLFLDSRPYNAHTTARDALAVGVPVLTCSGQAFAARVAGSLLTSLGVPELVTLTPEAFETRAVELAQDPSARSGLVHRIAAARNRSSAFDPARQARQLEAAFVAMTERGDRGESPAPIAVADDVQ